jgi:hypothetical protein
LGAGPPFSKFLDPPLIYSESKHYDDEQAPFPAIQSTTDETLVVEMRIWCIKIGNVFALHLKERYHGGLQLSLLKKTLPHTFNSYKLSKLITRWYQSKEVLIHDTIQTQTLDIPEVGSGV